MKDDKSIIQMRCTALLQYLGDLSWLQMYIKARYWYVIGYKRSTAK